MTNITDNITITINHDTHPNLYNLLSMSCVTDSIVAHDVDSDTTYDIRHIIDAAFNEVFKEEFGE